MPCHACLPCLPCLHHDALPCIAIYSNVAVGCHPPSYRLLVLLGASRATDLGNQESTQWSS